MAKITINEKQIEVPDGTTVLRAAEMAGIHIPRLCDHKELTPYGGCRLCIVEVEGARVPMAFCTLPVNNGMVVRTNTPVLKQSREFILSMLFSERNHFCPFCQVSGERLRTAKLSLPRRNDPLAHSTRLEQTSQ